MEPPELSERTKSTVMRLSICIPTYQRATYLQRILTCIYGQIVKFEKGADIEVIVSDNASTDETQQVVAPFIAKGLRYHRNESNIGPDANFLQLFKLAEGNYIWLPGDDDLFNSDTIDFILNCTKFNFDYLFLRTTGKSARPGRSARQINAKQLMINASIFTTFMTSQVIKSRLIKDRLAEATKFLGGFMAYYYIFLQALHNSKVCLVSDCKEVFPESTDNTGGYKFYKVWSESVISVLLASEFGNDEEVVRRFKMDLFLYLILPITYNMRLRSSSLGFESELPDEVLEINYGKRSYKMIWFRYLHSSQRFVRLLHIIVKIFCKSRRIALQQIA